MQSDQNYGGKGRVITEIRRSKKGWGT